LTAGCMAAPVYIEIDDGLRLAAQKRLGTTDGRRRILVCAYWPKGGRGGKTRTTSTTRHANASSTLSTGVTRHGRPVGGRWEPGASAAHGGRGRQARNLLLVDLAGRSRGAQCAVRRLQGSVPGRRGHQCRSGRRRWARRQ